MFPFERFEWRSRGGYRPNCRDCRKVKNAIYRETHRGQLRASAKRYYASNPQAVKERIQSTIAKNPERYREIHSSWKKRHPDAVRAMGNKRRVLVEQAGPHYTVADWQAIKARYGHRCLMCARREPDIRLTVDHIVPISRGGANTIHNLQPLCKSCNSKKHRGTLDLRPLTQAKMQL